MYRIGMIDDMRLLDALLKEIHDEILTRKVVVVVVIGREFGIRRV
jgi:hypothetical protein